MLLSSKIETTPRRDKPSEAETYIITGIFQISRAIKTFQNSVLANARVQVIKEMHLKRPIRIERALIGEILRSKPKTSVIQRHEDLLQGEGFRGPNAGWLWAHEEDDKSDWYREWKAELGEWCSSIWDDRRLHDWGRLQGKWSSEHYV